MAKLIRIIFFFPIHLLLWVIIRFRHFLYDLSVFTSTGFTVPVICIGNLELGGSGKTPMADFLLSRFSEKRKVAFLSRGYGRKSKGFRWLVQCSGPDEAGDEPWQLFQKWKGKALFSVDENRVRGIRRILAERPETDLIILDDAFQHRALRAGLNILLTPFHRPFFRNYLFPAGNLRDIRSASARAGMLVLSKAPSADADVLALAQDAVKKAGVNVKEVFVSELLYGSARNQEGLLLQEGSSVVCMAGLASNEAFFTYCKERCRVEKTISLPDHFRYSADFFSEQELNPDAVILCTEKDFYKITAVFPFPAKVFYLPVHIRVFPEVSFLNSIEKYLSA